MTYRKPYSVSELIDKREAVDRLTRENAELLAVVAELDRLYLVIESSVRFGSPRDLPQIRALAGMPAMLEAGRVRRAREALGADHAPD